MASGSLPCISFARCDGSGAPHGATVGGLRGGLRSPFFHKLPLSPRKTPGPPLLMIFMGGKLGGGPLLMLSRLAVGLDRAEEKRGPQVVGALCCRGCRQLSSDLVSFHWFSQPRGESFPAGPSGKMCPLQRRTDRELRPRAQLSLRASGCQEREFPLSSRGSQGHASGGVYRRIEHSGVITLHLSLLPHPRLPCGSSSEPHK